MEEMVQVSESGSLKGYSFKKWFAGTKESFKILVMGFLALATYYIMKSGLAPDLAEVIAFIVSSLSKWLMDSIDFWLSDVQV